MKIIGILIVVGVLIWLFIMTLSYVWWIWALFIGMALFGFGSLKDKS